MRRHLRRSSSTTAVRQAEVTAAKTMVTHTAETFGLEPARLAAVIRLLPRPRCIAWLVHEQGIEPQVPVFDKSERKSTVAYSLHREAA